MARKSSREGTPPGRSAPVPYHEIDFRGTAPATSRSVYLPTPFFTHPLHLLPRASSDSSAPGRRPRPVAARSGPAAAGRPQLHPRRFAPGPPHAPAHLLRPQLLPPRCAPRCGRPRHPGLQRVPLHGHPGFHPPAVRSVCQPDRGKGGVRGPGAALHPGGQRRVRHFPRNLSNRAGAPPSRCTTAASPRWRKTRPGTGASCLPSTTGGSPGWLRPARAWAPASGGPAKTTRPTR